MRSQPIVLRLFCFVVVVVVVVVVNVVFVLVVVLNVDFVLATSKVDLRLLVMEVEFLAGASGDVV